MSPEAPAKPASDLSQHKPTVWEPRRRRKAGEALSDAERAVITECERKYAPGKKAV